VSAFWLTSFTIDSFLIPDSNFVTMDIILLFILECSFLFERFKRSQLPLTMIILYNMFTISEGVLLSECSHVILIQFATNR